LPNPNLLLDRLRQSERLVQLVAPIAALAAHQNLRLHKIEYSFLKRNLMAPAVPSNHLQLKRDNPAKEIRKC
jgi:hypothetical protein